MRIVKILIALPMILLFGILRLFATAISWLYCRAANQRQMMRLFEVTICDLKDGGANGKEGTGADNGYDSCYSGKQRH